MSSQRTVISAKSAAIVTGAAGGIGASVAQQLAAMGQPVVVFDMSLAGAEKVVQSIIAAGGRALALQGDVGCESDWVRIVKASIDAFGGISTLVHNAGIGGPADLATGTLEQWNKVVSVNQSSIFLGCKYAETALAESAKRGEAASCVIIGSVLSSSGTWGDKPGYHATKAAAANMARCLAVAWAPSGVRVNAVCPGFIDTPLIRDLPSLDPILAATPLRRLGKANEVANAVTWLAGDAASYITGANLYVDGGFSVSK